MTMVAGCIFRDGADVIADSRATLESAASRHFDDSLQKILHLGPKLAIGYAGNVAIAGHIIQEIRKAISKNRRLNMPRRLAQEFPRIACHYFKIYKTSMPAGRENVGFVVAGVGDSEEISVWSFRSPTFEARRVESFDVLGSGEVVRSYLQETFKKLKEVNGLKERADWLIQGLESDLAKKAPYTEDTVGGLFQVILIGNRGIQPLWYGFYDMDPQSPGYARSMRLESGRWIQTDLSRQKEIVLREPLEFISNQFFKERRIHDIRLPDPGGKVGPGHLQYFVTCLEVKREVSSTEFVGEMSSFTGFGYPKTIPVVVATSFWGPRGNHTVSIRLEMKGTTAEIYSNNVEIQYPVEPVEIDVKVELKIQCPGFGFLEIFVDGERLGRRALHFLEAPGPIPPTREGTVDALRKYVGQQTVEEHNSCCDPALATQGAFLTYLMLCQEYQDQKMCHRFLGEMRAVYWKSYPLPFKFFLATCLRLPRGQHPIRVDLVDVATREAINVAKATVMASADCREVPVQGEIIAQIPKPGFYFFNLYIGDKLLSSTPIPFETDRGQFSYTLTEEGSKLVEAGELLILSKRSQPAS